jgi:predicted dehydrogenase
MPHRQAVQALASSGDQIEEAQFPICDQYTIEADQFSLAVLNDAPVPTQLTDAVANMRVIDAVVESSKSGGWVKL